MNPFASKKEDTVRCLGERELLRRIRAWLDPVCPPSPEGIGDDTAVLPFPRSERLLLTTDPIVFGRHFDGSTSPRHAGAKLLKRNLSDIAAMGGRPRAGVLSLFLPAKTSLEWLQEFHAGIVSEAAKYRVTINGGDICETGEFLGASLALTGTTVDGRTVTRSGAGAGDRVYVTGALGGSLLGHHLHFEPRLEEGRWLARQNEVKAMMDLSDGLAKDLLELIPPGSQVTIDLASLPISSAAREQSARSGRPAAAHALSDGEDYELLVALSSGADFEEFEERWRKRFELPLTCIGVFNTIDNGLERPILLRGDESGEISTLTGYEHFR